MANTTVLWLMPCPLCGGPVSLFASHGGRYGTEYAISCVKRTCGVNTAFQPNMTVDDVAYRWNEGIGLVRAGTPVNQVSGQMMAVEVRI